jgi:hypothetical protein
MSLWWLTYSRHGRLHGVVIVEAASLISACVGAEAHALDKGVSSVEGHELHAERAARIPAGYVGMMLPHKEARQLLNRVELGDDKRREIPEVSNSAADAVAVPMMLRAEQRRAIAMLATPGHNGATQPFLIAHGFGGAMISGLINRGLAILTREKIRAGGNMIHVTKLRITAAGRGALADED